jgi:hypothetical protein
LIVNGYKDVENRTWRPSYIGWLAIHAGKRFDQEGYRWVRTNFPEIPMPEPSQFKLGGIVGVATLTGWSTAPDSPWFFGPVGLMMHYARPVDLIPCCGKLGIFDIPDEMLPSLGLARAGKK